jgi:arylsulfatase A
MMKVNRIKNVLALAAVAVTVFAFNPRAEAKLAETKARPNIILIMADDIAYDNIGCYGSDFFKTPHLDKLAENGVKFNHCYSEPVCTPSRNKIMTGRDNIRNYVGFGTLDKKETTFGTMMKEAGYATAVAGKWQLHNGKNGSLAPDCGFDTYCLWNYPGTERSRFWNPSLIRDGEKVPITADSYGPDICTDFLIDFIKKNKERPFFAYYPMLLVHSPFVPTPDSKDRSSKNKLENYRDMVNYMDKCVGRIIDTLEENDLRKNTIMLFTTDNGTGRPLTYPYMGQQRKGEKAYPTDGGSHAPLIVNCPGIVSQGLVTDDLVDFSDFLPTLADIGGARLPNVTLDGRSFWPQCRGEKGSPREWIFQYYYPKFKTAAKEYGEGKPYIIWAQDQHYKLYSHGKFIDIKDRHEKINIQLGKGTQKAEAARKKLQAAIDSMPENNVDMKKQ